VAAKGMPPRQQKSPLRQQKTMIRGCLKANGYKQAYCSVAAIRPNDQRSAIAKRTATQWQQKRHATMSLQKSRMLRGG
jgi:hypothetical protein